MKSILKAIAATAVLGALILIVGCQSPGKVVSTQTSDVCPQCEMQTVTSPIKGLTYTRHICPPTCKDVETDTAKTSAALATYTGMDIETVHVCEHCKSIVAPCPV
ncbi:MAG: hypothetical protein U9P12_04795 [Verrucomicrobiota bacterium]|nr:hypothetical protein [Verrucomicrobiota bacterium]